LAKRLKAKILQASTSEVYGDPAVHPQPETYRGNVNPIGPRACYDEGKRCADITLATTLLAWQPTTPLADGLTRTIAYFDRLLGEHRLIEGSPGGLFR
jgi:nucleoside-diphosphate-sugar epimerase